MSAGSAYFGSRIPRHVGAEMERLAELGFTGVLHTFSENDLTWYRRTMKQLVALSHDAGLEVQIGPWGLGGLFGGEADTMFAARRPEAAQVLADGRRTPAACPNHPATRAFVREWIDAAIETGADRIFCDEPHWVHPEHFDMGQEAWGCRCEGCQALFTQRFGKPMPTEFTDEVRAFREDGLVAFIERFVAHVHAGGARSAVCLLPLTGGRHGITDWSRVASLPGLDTFGTDPYWKAFGQPVEPFVREYAQRVVALGGEHGVRPQLWIQGFRLDRADLEDVRTAVRVAREEGIDDLWVWAYEACGHMSALAGDDPEALWATLVAEMTGARVAGG
jgi:hypothetical protein